MTSFTMDKRARKHRGSLDASWGSDEPPETSPLNTLPLPLKTNDPIRRKLHPWFEDFEFYQFEHSYIIYYTAAKDEIYVTVVDLFTLQDLLRNVNLDHIRLIKKSKRYTRHPESAWKVVAAYCLTYGHKVTNGEASAMTFVMTKITDKKLKIIAPFWQKEAENMAERLAQRDKEILQDEVEALRNDRDKWRGMYVKEEYKEEVRLKLAVQSRVKKPKKGA